MLENKVDKDLLSAVADLHEVPMGAYNIRKNGEGMARQSTKNIIIEPKKDIFSSWVKLSIDNTDMLLINSQRDSVPGFFQEEVISSIPINQSEDICVVNKKHYMTVQIFNSWFTYFKHTPAYDDLILRYFKNYRIKDRSGTLISRSTLSPYDSAIKENSKILGWDWKLLASLIYQESKFKAGMGAEAMPVSWNLPRVLL